jgi:peptidoglycan/xylan/chitin deacetylase (PgdA/CDA1 family)
MLRRIAALAMRRPVHHTLIFHRVLAEPDPMSPDEPTVDWFRDLVAMLVARFEVIPLDEAADRAQSGRLRGGTVSITFDDGYADNYTTALPVLKDLGAPATFFVASGFLDGGRMWNDTIIETFRGLAEGHHEIDVPDVGPVDIDGWASRRGLAMQTILAWKHLPPQQRQERVEALSEHAEGLPDNLMMTSAQLRDMASHAGVTIGGHTRNHPILASLNNSEAGDEIALGKEDLERLLGQKVQVFAYPNGKQGRDYRDEHAKLVRDAGFDLAVATDWGTLSNKDDLYHIPRFTPWQRNLGRFAVDLARCHYGQIR